MSKPFAGKVPKYKKAAPIGTTFFKISAKRQCSQSTRVQVNVSGHHLQWITLPLYQH